MGRPGVTSEQVFVAIEEIVAAGLRPSVENIRQHLGNTGSPNTIGPMLANWYRQLPRRLEGRPAANDAGDLPAAALASFRLFWRDALQAAQIEARKALQQEQQELARRAGALDAQAAQLARDQDAVAASGRPWSRSSAPRRKLRRRRPSSAGCLQGTRGGRIAPRGGAAKCRRDRAARSPAGDPAAAGWPKARQRSSEPPPPATPAGLRGAGLFARALKMTPEVRALWARPKRGNRPFGGRASRSGKPRRV
jgi:hypothetical protein